MTRKTISVLARATLTGRTTRSFRSRLALTTILAAAPFLGYGRQAYADCLPGAPPTFICSGASGAQNINYDDADVSTVPGFSVSAPGSDAIFIHGDGHLQFTDNNASTISGDGIGLYVHSTGNSAANDGAITITIDSNITGGSNGIIADNDGDGSIEITTNGQVTGQNGDGIDAVNSSAGEDVTITTGAQSSVTGSYTGISAANHGSGDLEITANGDVYGNARDGIYGYNEGGDLTITQGEGSYVYANHVGIGAVNHGDGDLSVTANGSVYAYNDTGIFAYNASSGGDLKVTTGAQSEINGGYHGIDANNEGSGDLTIKANGLVYGYGGNGIIAFNSGGDLTITTGANSVVYGNTNGIYARNYGSGDLKVTADGEVTGYNNNGIDAVNSSSGNNLTIETGANSDVYGYNHGIFAKNYGSGDLGITANGIVTGNNDDGIHAYNSSDSNNLTIETGANSDVFGYDHGIYARNYGSGDLKVTANGIVTGYNYDGINARNGSDGNNLTIETGANSDVYGYENGIFARNYGSGDLEITADGKVTGYNYNGIDAVNSSDSNNLTIETGANSDVFGDDNGILAKNYGYGNLKITANGVVTGNVSDGIEASNYDGGNLTIITGAGSVVTGIGDDGIDANQYGSGDLDITVNGIVTGRNEDDSDGDGINAYNDGGGETIITIGSTGLVQGDDAGINVENTDGQDIEITNNGTVRNLSTESFDFAITTYGGATEITNNGDLIGTVETDLTNTYDDTLDNGGLWNMSNGISRFGAGHDEVNNTGTLLAADDPANLEATRIFDLDEFNNNGGLISLVDGQAGDEIRMSADGPGALEYKGTDGRLAVDAVLGPGPDGLSDRLYVDGNTDGNTLVHVNVVDATGANLDGIAVVRVINGTTSEEDFDLDGPLNAGFFTWDLRFDAVTNEHELFTSGVGVGSYEFAAGITGAQDIWHQTTGTLLQRQADLRALLGGTQVTPVADFAEPVEPTPVAHITPGFWLRGVGAYLERDDEENGFTLDRKQTIWGGLAGFDFGTENVGTQGDALMFGLFGGYLASDLDFDETNTEWHYDGPSVGAYATYLDDAFYVDATVKADFLNINIDPEDLAPASDDADTDAVNIGGRIDAGYKIGHTVFIEPQASLAVVHTEIDDVDIFGGTVKFDDETSVRGRLGLRLGYDYTGSDAIIYSGDVIASVWEDFSGDNDVTIADPALPSFGVSDDPGETLGDVSLGFSVLAPEGWSSFIRGNYQFGEDYEAVAGNVGLRYAW